MDDQKKFAGLKSLARMAARLAGRDPDERILVKDSDGVVFTDVAWRYPEYLKRAESAYDYLTRVSGL